MSAKPRPKPPVTLKVAAPVTKTKESLATLAALARDTARLNKEMNATKKQYEEKRKALYVGMAEQKLKTLDVPADKFGPAVFAEIKREVWEVPNIARLFKAVGRETFLKIVSATKKAVSDVAGDLVCKEVCDTKEGNENVSVKYL